ncbi:hypothetical protein [Amycolatopsis anabasis]|uniref:hypothetical protein n=1 Tax=Amycolatopsis anabasis TaxID=1840409 RepID=UPI00131C1E20|nr:hypothetical protein [Amycolatopsis anabasis]
MNALITLLHRALRGAELAQMRLLRWESATVRRWSEAIAHRLRTRYHLTDIDADPDEHNEHDTRRPVPLLRHLEIAAMKWSDDRAHRHAAQFTEAFCARHGIDRDALSSRTGHAAPARGRR